MNSRTLSPVGPFSVVCSSTGSNLENSVTVMCSSDSGVITSLSCTYDNASSAEVCGKCTMLIFELRYNFNLQAMRMEPL